MNDRLDLSKWKPSEALRVRLGKYIELCATEIGGNFYGTPSALTEDQAQAWRTEALGALAKVRVESELPLGSLSVALVDWSAVDRAVGLMEGANVGDPFIAFADLSSVLAAILFYDRVILLDDGGLAARANGLFHVDAFRSIRADAANPVKSSLSWLLDAHYRWAWNVFTEAEHIGANWIGWLSENWKALLPEATFPSHSGRAYESKFGYNTSPQRESWLDVLFQNRGDAWDLRPKSPEHLILDNDLRALIYERLAQTFEFGLSSGGEARSVHYMGGCLRMPLVLAREQLAEASLASRAALPDWLQAAWSKQFLTDNESFEMPFWTAALLAKSEDRASLAESVAQMREAAKRLRSHKAELEDALREGRSAVTGPLRKAVIGDAKGLTDWLETTMKLGGAVAEVGATAALKAQAPAVPTELLEPAKEAAAAMGGSDWLSRLAVKLFKPHLSIILKMSRDSRALEHSMVRAAKLFGLGGLDATQPLAFYGQLGTLSQKG